MDLCSCNNQLSKGDVTNLISRITLASLLAYIYMRLGIYTITIFLYVCDHQAPVYGSERHMGSSYSERQCLRRDMYSFTLRRIISIDTR